MRLHVGGGECEQPCALVGQRITVPGGELPERVEMEDGGCLCLGDPPGAGDEAIDEEGAGPNGFGGSLNLYGYVGNNPVGLIDPLGLRGWGNPLDGGDEAIDAVTDFVTSSSITQGLQRADMVPMTETCTGVAIAATWVTGGGSAAAVPACAVTEIAIGAGTVVATEVQIWTSGYSVDRNIAAEQANLLNFLVDFEQQFFFVQEGFEIYLYYYSDKVLDCSPQLSPPPVADASPILSGPMGPGNLSHSGRKTYQDGDRFQ